MLSETDVKSVKDSSAGERSQRSENETCKPELPYFRLYAGVRFSRPITENDNLSPGGYEFVFRDNEGKDFPLAFDFQYSEMSVSRDDPCVFEYMQKCPDYAAFPELAQLKHEHLGNVVSVRKFHIFTDTHDGSDPLIPEKILYATFTDDNYKDYDIDQQLLDAVEM